MQEQRTTCDSAPQPGTGKPSRISLSDFDRMEARLPAVGDHVPGHAPAAPTQRLVIEADEVTFRVGEAVLSLTKENGGTLEIRARHVRLRGEEIVSQATGTNAVVGEHVVAEAEMHADLLGKLVRIDGQCVKINS
jgi:hypothetical protein